MKLTADQYYYVYLCMLEEPAILKSLSYSSAFSVFNQASFKAKNIGASSSDLFISMCQTIAY